MAMRPRSATPGTILCVISTVCLALASFCTPLIKSLYIFKATINSGSLGGTLTIGVLGYCLERGGSTTCSGTSVGYELDLNALLNINNDRIAIPEVVAKWITYVLVLHIVALGLAAVASCFGLLAHCRDFAMSCVSSCFAGMAGSIALTAFVFDIVIYFVAKSRIPGSSSIGPATWLTLAGFVCLFVSGCAFSCGRRCMSARGPRDREGGARGERLEHDKSYADEARIEAIRAEEERKARQAPGGGLPGFQPYESQTQPLNRDDEYLHEEEDEDVGMARRGAYQQHDGDGGYGAGAGMAGAAAGIGMGRAGMGGRDGSESGQSNRAGYGAGQRSHPSDDSYYAAGQPTPGGYPPIQENNGHYAADPYTDPYAAPAPIPSQTPYRHPSADPYQNPAQPNPYDNNAYVTNNPQPSDSQHSQYLSSASHYSQNSPLPTGNSSQMQHDPRLAPMQSGFVSPPHQQSQSQHLQPSSQQYGYQPSPSPSPSDPYGGYINARTPSPGPILAPSPQRLAHPTALTPRGSASAVRGLPEPPTYEMASVGTSAHDQAAGPSGSDGYAPAAAVSNRPEKSSYYTGGR